MYKDFESFLIKHQETIRRLSNIVITSCEITNDISKANYWIPIDDPTFKIKSQITLGKGYRLFWDKYEQETLIVDDCGNFSAIPNCHNGEFLIIK
ncbi:hypothetical protein BBD41_27210 [Paenibacillus ihbetae]|uniref:Uncharacterized protein n=1 Tax=Paenibacillus ihbetae TaxID=1870820 RepID=A0A1B2E7R8_9BACL|nr:hypothetical protein [Paenibacillus ihbetae]ANY75967.1 hypothetical protein BBD41_27210 [Paenibacillus ihbetae]